VTEFTPWSALFGGVILGTSALFLLWLNGNVAGISGIVSQAMQRTQSKGMWRWMFICGLIFSPVMIRFIVFGLPEKIDVS